jgi:hypothetical protein
MIALEKAVILVENQECDTNIVNLCWVFSLRKLTENQEAIAVTQHLESSDFLSNCPRKACIICKYQEIDKEMCSIISFCLFFREQKIQEALQCDSAFWEF